MMQALVTQVRAFTSVYESLRKKLLKSEYQFMDC